MRTRTPQKSAAEEAAISADIRGWLRRQIDTSAWREELTERERALLTARFGLDGRPEQSAYELANIYGLTTGRIDVILHSAARRLMWADAMRRGLWPEGLRRFMR